MQLYKHYTGAVLYYITNSNVWTILKNIHQKVDKVTEMESARLGSIYMEPFLVRQLGHAIENETKLCKNSKLAWLSISRPAVTKLIKNGPCPLKIGLWVDVEDELLYSLQQKRKPATSTL